MDNKECYNIVYTSMLNFLKSFLYFDNKPEERLPMVEDHLNQDLIVLKNFFANVPYVFCSPSHNSYKKSLEKLNDNDLKEIIEDLKKDIGGKK